MRLTFSNMSQHITDLPKSYTSPEIGFAEPQLGYKDGLLSLGDGRYGVSNISYAPPLPKSVTLPGRADMVMKMKEAPLSYSIKPFEKEIALGPTTTPIIDGTKWSEELNKYIKGQSDALPTLPLIGIVVGGVGSGKTSLLVQLLQVYGHPECFKEIRIYSPSLGADPVLLTYLADRHPDIDVVVGKNPDLEYMMKKQQEVEMAFAPEYDVALRGRRKKPKMARTYLQMTQTEPDSISHPWTNLDGKGHGRIPLLPDYTHLRKNPPPILIPLLEHERQQRSLAKAKPKLIGIREQTVHAQEQYARRDRLFSKSLDNFAPPSVDKPIDITTAHPMEHVVNVNLEYPSIINLQSNIQQALLRDKDPIKYGKHHDIKPGLIIFDDCAYQFDSGPFAKTFLRWLTVIRHSHCAVLFMFQKKTAVPPIIRDLATHLFLFRVNNGRELESMEEEWGGTVPDFLGKYHAATTGVGDRTKDFLYVDLRSGGKAYRAFSGELVAKRSEFTQ